MGRVRADASQLCGQDRWQQRGTLLGRNGSGGLCGLVAKPVGLNQVAGGYCRRGLGLVYVPVAPKGCYGTVTWST